MWGHLTGRQSPAAFRDGVAAFLQEATTSYQTNDCCIQIALGPLATADGSAFIDTFFENVALHLDRNEAGASASISQTDFAKCLDWFILNGENLPQDATDLYFALNRQHLIHAWGFSDSHDFPGAGGQLVEAYGSLQYVGTHLTFRSIDEYRWVKDIAKRTLRIQMNDKHIRPRTHMAG